MRFRPRAHGIVAALVASVAACAVGAPRPHAAFGDDRTLSLFNIHTKETTTVQFRKGGRAVPGALEKLNWAMRDWRRDEATEMDPALIDLLWEIHAELGSKEPIHIISAFRSRNTNELLRKTVGGQASESRHILGKAVDVHFPDVPLRNLRYSALIRERGGVGYYPTSALPFVHVDTDRVRHWPRLPRYELALLFPNGRTQHQPAEGGPISIDDVRTARMQYGELAQQVAGFHDARGKARNVGGTAIALAPPMPQPAVRPGLQQVAYSPQLTEPPRVVDRPSRMLGPSAAERARLTELASLASLLPAAADAAPKLVHGPQPAQRRPATSASLSGGEMPAAGAPADRPRLAALDARTDAGRGDALLRGFGWGNGFAPAPAYDEEHPDELSYRPFPIAPLLTATASADDPALVAMYAPDPQRTLELLDLAGTMPPMRLRPPHQLAALMLSQQFKGEAINLSALGERAGADGAALSSRRVATSPR